MWQQELNKKLQINKIKMKAIKALQVLTICKSKKQQFDLL